MTNIECLKIEEEKNARLIRIGHFLISLLLTIFCKCSFCFYAPSLKAFHFKTHNPSYDLRDVYVRDYSFHVHVLCKLYNNFYIYTSTVLPFSYHQF